MQTPSVALNRPVGVRGAAPAAAIPSMGFVDAIAACFRKYVGFSGRARRAEYWYWILFTMLLCVVALVALPKVVGATMAVNAYSLINLALFLPGLSVLVRRLHDTDRSGWWSLLPITGIGAIVLLVWLCQGGTQGQNRFGPRTT